MSNHLSN